MNGASVQRHCCYFSHFHKDTVVGFCILNLNLSVFVCEQVFCKDERGLREFLFTFKGAEFLVQFH